MAIPALSLALDQHETSLDKTEGYHAALSLSLSLCVCVCVSLSESWRCINSLGLQAHETCTDAVCLGASAKRRDASICDLWQPSKEAVKRLKLEQLLVELFVDKPAIDKTSRLESRI